MNLRPTITSFSIALIIGLTVHDSVVSQEIQYGVRPFFLIEAMADSPLKSKLQSCKNQNPKRSNFSIAHRGAPLQFPEHTKESNNAAAIMGAGIFECDVTFTKDKQLVCRHAQNDLHATTNILLTELSQKCSKPFKPAIDQTPASAECRTSDISLAEFKTLRGKMDGFNPNATTVEQYINGTPTWRTNLYVNRGATLLTHRESIQLIKSYDGIFTPELKSPIVPMPYEGFTQNDYAQALINEYKQAGISPKAVFPQSFNLQDVLYWIQHEPEFGSQAIYLDDRYLQKDFDPARPDLLKPSMTQLYTQGVRYVGPPIWALLTLDKKNQIVPSAYAKEAKKAGLKIITWTLDRDGPLIHGGGWYHQSIKKAIHNDGQIYEVLDVLAQQVGVQGVFSDWPATVTYYANCMGLE